MSFAKSPAPPADAGIALRDAFTDVCENSFFAYVEQCEPLRFAEVVDRFDQQTRWPDGGAAAGRKTQSEWLKSSVGFRGPFAGAIEVIMPEHLARTLVTAILGEAPEAGLPEHQVFDGVGEFTNMVCGAWLTNMCSAQAFELRAPAVTRMAVDWTPVTDAGWNDDLWHRLAVNDLPVRVRFRPQAG
jgi:hypothetical protein